MAGMLWGKFYWSDWASDPALRVCSLAAQGLWMRMLCVAAEADPTGYVTINGNALGVTDIARLAGVTETECESLLAELDRNGVFSRTRNGTIYSRRMTGDAKKAALARKNGKKGGNPTLGKDSENPPPDNPPDNGRLKLKKLRSQKPERQPELTNSPSSKVDSSFHDLEFRSFVRSFVEGWPAAEIAVLALEFPAVDVPGVLPELVEWAAGKGIRDGTELKSAVYGALKGRQAKTALGAALLDIGRPKPAGTAPDDPKRTVVSDRLVQALARRRRA